MINFAPAPLFEQVNATGTRTSRRMSTSSRRSGSRREPSPRVAPSRVAASPVAFECRLLDTLSFGNSTVVFGRVLLAAVDEGVLGDRDLPDVRKLLPAGPPGPHPVG